MKTHAFQIRRHNGGAMLVVISLLGGVLLLMVLGVASMFHQGSDTRALRNCLVGKKDLSWQDRIVVNAGGLTFGAVRLASKFLDIPAEARAGIASVRGAEVGIFRGGSAAPEVRAAALAKANEVMAKRGWSRVLAVQERRESVMVYVREKGLDTRNLVCCAVVWNENELVLVKVKGNPEPLFELLQEQMRKEGVLLLGARRSASLAFQL